MNRPPLATEIEGTLPQDGPAAGWLPKLSIGYAVLAIGLAAIVVPTMVDIARVSCDSEQGAHGPIVLAIAVWLLIRSWPDLKREARPGSALIGGVALAVMLLGYVAAHIVGSVMLQSAATYGALVSSLFLLVGWRAMRAAWFPILYFLFVLPPPGSLVALATQPLRLEIASLAVAILSWFGLPVAREGLLIYVGQYALEVKAACGGLNSIISLSAVGLFYAYALHRANLRYCILLAIVSVACAILANLCRVILLMLITYYLGNKAAQGFLHGAAGMFMFVAALALVIGFDHVAGPIRRKLASS
jgi:exosortase